MRLLPLLLGAAIQAIAPAGPPLPYVEHGACPFECCTYRDWTAQTKLTAYESHDPRSPKTALFTIAAGEQVTAMTGLVRTTAAGVVLVTAPTTVTVVSRRFPTSPTESMTFQAGERVYLLVPRGEGWMAGWYQGRVLDEFDGTTFGRPEDCAKWQKCTGTIERMPAFDWWVRVRNARRQIGWVLMPRDRPSFHGPDRCGPPQI